MRLSRASVADAAVLIATGLTLLGARLLYRWARIGDDGIARTDFGGDDT